MKVNGVRIASDEYIDQLSQMHDRPRKWGATKPERSGLKVKGWAEQLGVRTILDYGCGKGRLVDWLNQQPALTALGFDPGNSVYGSWPTSADMLISNDVMEHVEPECLADVIALQKDSGARYMYHRIHTKPAKKILPDGRNAHLIQERGGWWQEQYEDEEWVCETMKDDGTIVELYMVRSKPQT